MKLLLVSAAFPPHRSGEATNAFFLSREIAARGIEVDVLTTMGAAASDRAGVRVHPIMRDWSWSEVGRLRRFVKRVQPDAILLMYIGWTYRFEFMITFAPTYLKAMLPGVPFVTRFENTMGADPRHTSMLSRTIRKLAARIGSRDDVDYSFGTLLRDSDHVIVLSEAHRLTLASCLPAVERKITVLPPSINMRLSDPGEGSARRRGRAMLGLEDGDFVVAYIGYLHAGKGLESLLRAVQSLGRERHELRLVLIGGSIAPESGNAETYAQELRELARGLGIEDRVRWTGEYTWDREDASLYLRAADACVLPFRKGIHLNNSSVASVTAHGLPLVSTRGELVERAFVDGENILFCQPESPGELARAIERVMDDRELRERLAAGASRLAADWFSWDRLVGRTLEACRLPSSEGRASRLPSPEPAGV
jgi:glycosyltransferase involved in cell wall biosynthesis